ncbi:sorting nexin-27 isoform X1 [Hydra vulgaris]|uniref:Sorting nexin-27 n=1 Tax=Hydra vulgaris TaxID=6087 RepID=T2M6S8_HYDVU|nr:sorting nexin-27 [Hydra vulgaris]
MADDEQDSDLENSLKDEEENKDQYAPRYVKIKKGEKGFGFNVRGQVSEGGQMKAINGQLYPPLQMISAVLEGGPADKAKVRVGDRILEVNGVNCEGTDHRAVVDLIKQGKDYLTLLIISVSPSEARKLDGSEVCGSDYIDYSDRRSIPITIPDFKYLEKDGEKYVVYNIYINGKYRCCRRYNEFANLHSDLKKKFTDYPFPKLPTKWPLKLSDQQLDSRRRGLEVYIEDVTAIREIYESDIMEKFLLEEHTQRYNSQNQSGVNQKIDSNEKEIKINLPDKTILSVFLPNKKQKTEQIYECVVKKLGLSDYSATFFALFQIMENDFERKLESSEFPYSIYQRSVVESGETKLAFRKWVFTLTREIEMCNDPVALNLLYYQAASDIRKGLIKPENKIQKIKEYNSTNNKIPFLEVARTLDGYGDIVFPHCECDARKEGHVILRLSLKNLTMVACTSDGVKEDQEHNFTWDEIQSWDADTEAMCFWFQYSKSGRNPRQVRIYSLYYKYIEDCCKRIATELSWCKKDYSGSPILNNTSASESSTKSKLTTKAKTTVNHINDGDL